MNMTKDQLLELVKTKGSEMTWKEKCHLTVLLSLPAIIAQFSFIAMQMIDAAMLGHLSTDEAAAVGLVSTTIWLFGGLTSAFATGYSVQVAHHIGANDERGARDIIRQGLLAGFFFSIGLAIIGFSIAPHLPYWLGAAEKICGEASRYFSIFCCGLPLIVLNSIAAGSLRCSGDIKTPSILMTVMCFINVVCNYIFIFPLHQGTAGAAYGTIVAYTVTMLAMMYVMIFRDKVLRFSNDGEFFNTSWQSLSRYIPTRKILKKAGRIGLPMGLERSVMCSAQVMISSIIAPLGTVAIAANTFAINVESLCYMPGYGIGEAATTLVGQSKGAERRDYMKSFAWISMVLGTAIMALMGVIMWITAPQALSLITPDTRVITLGAEILRIEAWAEPGFAASIIAYSVFVGAGKTLIPTFMNIGSIWGVRVVLTLILAPTYGLHGVWIAMAAELLFRGLIFAMRLCTDGWTYIKPFELRSINKEKEA